MMGPGLNGRVAPIRRSRRLELMSSTDRQTTLVTYLEMTAPAPVTRLWPSPGLRIERLRDPSVRFYRYLYDAVGGDWSWLARRQTPDATLLAEISHPDVDVELLTEGGVPAGYGEVDRRGGEDVKIAYFGLVPEAVGRGFGHWFLEQIVARAWRSRPRRVWLHTCDLDHPRALSTYAAVGFKIYDRRLEPIVPLRATG